MRQASAEAVSASTPGLDEQPLEEAVLVEGGLGEAPALLGQPHVAADHLGEAPGAPGCRAPW